MITVLPEGRAEVVAFSLREIRGFLYRDQLDVGPTFASRAAQAPFSLHDMHMHVLAPAIDCPEHRTLHAVRAHKQLFGSAVLVSPL